MAKKLVVTGNEPDFFPFQYVENGENKGYGVDLLAYVAKDMGIEYRQILLPWDGVLPGLESKKFDFISDVLLMTPERLEKYLFTSPIADGSVAVLVRKDNKDIQSPADMAGKVVGALRGSAMMKILKDYNTTELNGGVKEIKEFVGYPEAYEDLKNGRIDAVANTMPNLQALVMKFPDQYKIVDKIGPKVYLGWAFRKEDKALRDRVEQSITKAKEDGTIAKLLEKYFAESYDLPKDVPN
ncbi:transporter substrate-binding domain-containing protein [Paenibacillus beijingensis]|nr:transporter substrate-binding domain-containing protein [Paenibacillus beijingensis]